MKRSRCMLNDLDQDIRDHIQRETQDNIDRGMTPEEAHYAAFRKFGNPALVKEDARGVWVRRWLEHHGHDVRYGLRRHAAQSGIHGRSGALTCARHRCRHRHLQPDRRRLLKMLPVQNPQQLLLLKWASYGWPDPIVNGFAGDWHQDKSGRTTSTSLSGIRANPHDFTNRVLHGRTRSARWWLWHGPLRTALLVKPQGIAAKLSPAVPAISHFPGVRALGSQRREGSRLLRGQVG